MIAIGLGVQWSKMLRTALFSAFVFFVGSATAFASIDKGLLALVPPGTGVIAAVDVNRARGSQFGQFLIDRVGASDSNFESFLSKTGFDMRRGVQDFVFASPANSHSAGAILARGHFDLSRIDAAARAHGCVVETYRGVHLILNSGRTDRSALAFPAPGIAVIADIATVEQIIRSRNVPATLPPALRQLITSVGDDNDAWFASLSAGMLASPEVAHWNRAAAAAVKTIREASGGIRLNDPIVITTHAVTGSSQEAEALSVVVRGMAALARMGHPSDPYLAVLAAAQGLKIGADGNAVNLAFSLPENEAEQLAKSLARTGLAAH